MPDEFLSPRSTSVDKLVKDSGASSPQAMSIVAKRWVQVLALGLRDGLKSSLETEQGRWPVKATKIVKECRKPFEGHDVRRRTRNLWEGLEASALDRSLPVLPEEHPLGAGRSANLVALLLLVGGGGVKFRQQKGERKGYPLSSAEDAPTCIGRARRISSIELVSETAVGGI
ncbi:hypothetical protein M406DRAFT_331075 [Cryphonectria parasitica EP155]|uniref:Uncharacterized protein n=1 Tax=Cryphonectria parasitica (strain ATCC 38755 / EP155) TaxID=660469 RepID=A0A9P4Y0I4_CRYP1|nr:uncharacterized protein M406DRAFT_331075 [Cryphonectria parasitica EP155]KAF3764754.1 hypothetical protein M406DRAFT_331075 [Cryphonectria parasitica EP155]